MSDDNEPSTSGAKSILGIAAVACVACCIGPILAVLGAIAALGVVSTILIGAAGLLIAAAAIAAFIIVRRRRSHSTCGVEPERVPVELSRPESAEAAEADEQTATAGDEDGEDERVLGIDVESPAAVVAAVVVSLALAVGLWLRKQRWLALVAVGFGIAFAVFDIAEINHQLDESRTGLALLAGAIALTHVAAAASAGLSARPTGLP